MILLTEPATDFPYIAEHMRHVDREEVMASSGHSPMESLKTSYEKSELCFTYHTDKPVAVFGLGSHPTSDAVGIPWMLGTDEMQQHPLEVARQSRWYVNQFNNWYPILFNCVAEWNHLSLRWLQWCGFVPLGDVFMGGVRFIKMVKVTGDYNVQPSSRSV